MKARIKATGDICQHYDPNRTMCAPVKVSDYGQFSASLKQSTVDWQHYRIQAAIAAMQGMLANPQTFEQLEHDERYKDIRGGDKLQIVAIASVMYGYTLVEELKKKIQR
jgi:hypothetical protein